MRRVAAGLAMGTVMLGVVGALAGCKPGSSVQSVAAAYFHDIAGGDWKDACALLTDDLRHSLGDCPATLKRRHDLGREADDELRYATVSRVYYRKDGTAEVDNSSVQVTRTTKARDGSVQKKKVRSIGVYQATDGKGIILTKVGGVWRISGGGV